MAIPWFLAMTGAEIRFCPSLPQNTAWMACHFSPCSRGLSNLPDAIPEGALLVLDDQWPFSGHDGEQIAAELAGCVREKACSGVLLDFQRPGIREEAALAAGLSEALPCPVAVTACYARGNQAAVFLPPLPCHVPLQEHTAPWPGRELWLELALDGEVITLTDKGVDIFPGEYQEADGFADRNLHCHYTAAVEEDRAVFALWRTREDLAGLLEEADGITQAVGLYQELN